MADAFAVLFAVMIGMGILVQWARSPWVVAVLKAGLCVLAALWLLDAARRGGPLRWSPVLAPLLAVAAWGPLQIAAKTTVDRWATEQAALDWLVRLTAGFLALQLFEDGRRRKHLLELLVWFGLALAVVATLQRFTSPGRIFWLAEGDAGGGMGPFVYFNQYAAFMETVLPVVLLAALEGRERAWRYWFAAAVIAASVVASGSRAGVLLTAAEAAAVPLLWRRRTGLPWRSAGRGALVAAALTAALVAAVGLGPLAEKFRRADPWGERRHLTLATIEMARERPGLGFGLGTWAIAYPAYARFDDGLFDNQAHNDWAQWAAEGGVPFFALMVVFAALLARRALRSIWGVGLVALLVHGLVDYPFQQRPALGYYFFALAGLAALDGEPALRQ